MASFETVRSPFELYQAFLKSIGELVDKIRHAGRLSFLKVVLPTIGPSNPDSFVAGPGLVSVGIEWSEPYLPDTLMVTLDGQDVTGQFNRTSPATASLDVSLGLHSLEAQIDLCDSPLGTPNHFTRHTSVVEFKAVSVPLFEMGLSPGILYVVPGGYYYINVLIDRKGLFLGDVMVQVVSVTGGVSVEPGGDFLLLSGTQTCGTIPVRGECAATSGLLTVQAQSSASADYPAWRTVAWVAIEPMIF